MSTSHMKKYVNIVRNQLNTTANEIWDKNSQTKVETNKSSRRRVVELETYPLS